MAKNALKDKFNFVITYLLEIHLKISSEFMNADNYNQIMQII